MFNKLYLKFWRMFSRVVGTFSIIGTFALIVTIVAGIVWLCQHFHF